MTRRLEHNQQRFINTSKLSTSIVGLWFYRIKSLVEWIMLLKTFPTCRYKFPLKIVINNNNLQHLGVWRLGKLGLKNEIHFFAKLIIFYRHLHSFSNTDKILQISDQVRMDLRFCRECHSRQRFFVACFRRAHDDENLKFTPEKPSNRALITRFSSQLIGNL